MPPVDWPQLIAALLGALATYFYQHWSKAPLPGPAPAPAAPSAAPHLLDVQNPLVQGLLLLLRQALEKDRPPSPPAA